jgi:hypothetical protein
MARVSQLSSVLHLYQLLLDLQLLQTILEDLLLSLALRLISMRDWYHRYVGLDLSAVNSGRETWLALTTRTSSSSSLMTIGLDLALFWSREGCGLECGRGVLLADALSLSRAYCILDLISGCDRLHSGRTRKFSSSAPVSFLIFLGGGCSVSLSPLSGDFAAVRSVVPPPP